MVATAIPRLLLRYLTHIVILFFLISFCIFVSIYHFSSSRVIHHRSQSIYRFSQYFIPIRQLINRLLHFLGIATINRIHQRTKPAERNSIKYFTNPREKRFSNSDEQVSRQYIIKNTGNGIEHCIQQSAYQIAQTIFKHINDRQNPSNNRNFSQIFRRFSYRVLHPIRRLNNPTIRTTQTTGRQFG